MNPIVSKPWNGPKLLASEPNIQSLSYSSPVLFFSRIVHVPHCKRSIHASMTLYPVLVFFRLEHVLLRLPYMLQWRCLQFLRHWTVLSLLFSVARFNKNDGSSAQTTNRHSVSAARRSIFLMKEVFTFLFFEKNVYFFLTITLIATWGKFSLRLISPLSPSSINLIFTSRVIALSLFMSFHLL